MKELKKSVADQVKKSEDMQGYIASDYYGFSRLPTDQKKPTKKHA
ncbi:MULTISPECIES: hypothetical protein [Helicobacter]|nr:MULTISPECIES: hypothetical protein [Helicobacter]